MSKFDDLNFKFKEIADDRTISLLEKIGQALPIIYKAIPKQLVLPKIFPVRVDNEVKAKITSLPDVKISNFSELVKYLQATEVRLGQMAQAISMIATQPPPKTPEFKIPPIDTSAIVEALSNIPVGQSGDNEDVISAIMKVQEAVAFLANRPSMTTPPVTHISINALNGAVKTSQIQLGSTVTPLPAIALVNRRSLQFYNNGANTVYFGGANVTTANGIPVPSGAYSDILDMGVNMLVYGISAAGQNNDIRVLEISDEGSGR